MYIGAVRVSIYTYMFVGEISDSDSILLKKFHIQYMYENYIEYSFRTIYANRPLKNKRKFDIV